MKMVFAIVGLFAVVAALWNFLKGEFLGSIAGTLLAFMMNQTLKAWKDEE